jgi:hypothetical protein
VCPGFWHEPVHGEIAGDNSGEKNPLVFQSVIIKIELTGLKPGFLVRYRHH